MNLYFQKIESLSRYVVINYLASFFNVYCINEYPKSGGTWVANMLGDALGVPVSRHRYPPLSSSILHSHYKNIKNPNNVILVWRDGRDVMVSWYYHCLFDLQYDGVILNKEIVRKTKNVLRFKDINAIDRNLPEFIDYCFNTQSYPRFNWTEFVDYWYGREDVVQVFYEKIRREPVIELKKLYKSLVGKDLPDDDAEQIVNKYSFDNQKNNQRKILGVNSFLRKGLVGNWRKHFNCESRKLFSDYAGESLIKLGYEKDNTWM